MVESRGATRRMTLPADDLRALLEGLRARIADLLVRL
jgi:hypothetical protein